jgi:hypothetical protein
VIAEILVTLGMRLLWGLLVLGERASVHAVVVGTIRAHFTRSRSLVSSFVSGAGVIRLLHHSFLRPST